MSKQNINLTEQQQHAIDETSLWFNIWAQNGKKDSQIFYIAGYAGVGKSTIVPYIIDSIGINDSDVCYATYTGKAAMVLSDKLGKKVSTIHGLCYVLEEEYMDATTKTPVLNWKIRKDSPLTKAKLLVLDEVSMVNKDMMADLLHFNVPTLVLGDPFQLPPVEGDAYFNSAYEPDVFLTEIHRQALENPIIWLSREVRNGKNIKHGTYGDSVIKMRNDEVTDDIFLDADQVIVGTNKTRKDFNSWFRDALGRTQNGVMPVEDDKLICLRNNWADGLVNGMMLTATSRAQATKNRQKFKLSFTAQESADSTLTFKDKWCNASDILGAKLDIPYWEQKKLVSLDYGYAITCHKSQGSQYNDVVFVDEGFGSWLDDNTYYRHLYTAITRTTNRLVILR